MTGEIEITASRVVLAGVGFAFVTFVAISPFTFDGVSIVGQSAYAAAGGNGNGNNGNGNGNGGSVDGGANHGSVASSLGSLNAAPASPNALANANGKSRVGALANYRESLIGSMEDYTAARELLTAAELALEGFTPVDPDDLTE